MTWRDALSLTPAYLTEHQVLVAEAPGGEAALVGCSALEDHGDHWCLGHVWVDPRMHGRGIGRLLVERALGLARAQRPRWVVRVDADPNAAGFYRRLGASEVGTIPAPMAGAPARTLPIFEFAAAPESRPR
jgi:GNAT superfamily N-acetyltransferase